jgi:hypothetical protein
VDNDADEEAARLEELRRIKRATLHELDKQAAQYSSVNTPPHIQTERQRLRRELGMVESVIASPLDASIGTDLGEGGRFVAYIELMRQGDRATLEAVARLEEQLTTIVRSGMRRDIALLIIVVVVVALAMVMLFWIGRISGPSGAWVSWILR